MMDIIGALNHYLLPSMEIALLIWGIWFIFCLVLRKKGSYLEWRGRFLLLTSLAGIVFLTDAYKVFVDGFPKFFMAPNLVPVFYSVQSLIENPVVSIAQMGYNVILFAPVGFLLPVSFSKYRWNWWKVLLISLVMAGIIEGLEYCSGRYMDIDDFVFNCSGTWIGYFVYTRICLWWQAREFGSKQ